MVSVSTKFKMININHVENNQLDQMDQNDQLHSDKTDDDLFACHGFCDRPGFNRKSKVMITSRDVFDSLEPSRKLALWAYAKRVHGKHNLFHFTFKGNVFVVDKGNQRVCLSNSEKP